MMALQMRQDSLQTYRLAQDLGPVPSPPHNFKAHLSRSEEGTASCARTKDQEISLSNNDPSAPILTDLDDVKQSHDGSKNCLLSTCTNVTGFENPFQSPSTQALVGSTSLVTPIGSVSTNNGSVAPTAKSAIGGKLTCWSTLSNEEKEKCRGTKCQTLRLGKHAWFTDGELKSLYLEKLERLIDRLLSANHRKIYRKSRASMTYYPVLLGASEDIDIAEPTILLQTTDADVGHRLMQCIKQSQQYRKISLVFSIQVDQQTVTYPAADSIMSQSSDYDTATSVNACGRMAYVKCLPLNSNAAWKRATCGGVILLHDRFYALTVAHCLLTTSHDRLSSTLQSLTDCGSENTAIDSDWNSNSDHSFNDLSSDDEDASGPASSMLTYSTNGPASDVVAYFDDVALNIDNPESRLQVVDKTEPSKPLFLGRIRNAHSGTANYAPPSSFSLDSDWALIPIDDARFEHVNQFRIPHLHDTAITIRGVKGKREKRPDVLYLAAGYSGIMQVSVVDDSSRHCFPWGQTCHDVLSIDCVINPGDSGAWLFDVDGFLHGMAIATVPSLRTTYVLPAEDLLRDITAQHGLNIDLDMVLPRSSPIILPIRAEIHDRRQIDIEDQTSNILPYSYKARLNTEALLSKDNACTDVSSTHDEMLDARQTGSLLAVSQPKRIKIEQQTPVDVSEHSEKLKIATSVMPEGSTSTYTGTGSIEVAALATEKLLPVQDSLSAAQESTASKATFSAGRRNHSEETALTIAPANGDLELVQTLSEGGSSVNRQGERFADNALQAASRYGHKTIAQLLLDVGADASAVEGMHGDNAIQIALKNGKLEVMQTLLDTGADVNNTNGKPSGTVLQLTSNYGEKEAIQISSGTNVIANAPDRNYQSPLRKRSAEPYFMRNAELPNPLAPVRDDPRLLTVDNVVSLEASTITREKAYVGWVHVEDETPSLTKLENIFEDCISTRSLPKSHDIGARLLQRVKSIHEKRFALGKYMVSGVTRYDGKSHMEDGGDQSCLFMSFPYFLVTDKIFDTAKASETPDGHPVRSLIQTRYRLESTRDRDSKQSILSLAHETIAGLTQIPSKPLHKSSSILRWTSRIHVPHLWALSTVGDFMVTNGPISTTDLRGSFLTRDTLKLEKRLIRFELDDGTSKVNDFFYPVECCDWYYGLMNTKRKILSNLGLRKPRHMRDSYSSADSHIFGLYTNLMNKEVLISNNNWIKILQNQAQMQRYPLGQIVITVRRQITDLSMTELPTSAMAANDLNTTSDHLRAPKMRPTKPPKSASLSVPRHGMEPQFHSFESFFVWPLPQDRSTDTNRPDRNRALRWLNKLAENVIDLYISDLDKVFQTVQHHAAQMPSPSSVLINPPISGISHEQLRTEVFPSLNQLQTYSNENVGGHTHNMKVSEYFQIAVCFLGWFVPDPRTAGSDEILRHPFVLIYWGVCRRILISIIACEFTVDELSQMLEHMNNLNTLAESLHMGVRKYREQNGRSREWKQNSGPDPDQRIMDESAVIPSSIPVALEHVVSMFFTIVRFTTRPPQERDLRVFQDTVKPDYDKAINALESAERFLITAANKTKPQNSFGPILTPETIILLLIERLSKGVNQNGTFNMTKVYTMILEQLTQRVEKHNSRQLLLDLNQVGEEIDIIIDVLVQQIRCLEDLEAYLDPTTFDNPSPERRTRFDFERVETEKVLQSLKGQKNDFEELRQSGRMLTDRTVKLRESSLSRNNRSVILLTSMTIICLPLSALTGILGMNAKQLSGPSYTVDYFWKASLTCVGISILVGGLVLNYWNEIKRALTRWWDAKSTHKA